MNQFTADKSLNSQNLTKFKRFKTLRDMGLFYSVDFRIGYLGAICLLHLQFRSQDKSQTEWHRQKWLFQILCN